MVVPTIKKYPNRKLYDMDSKQYITLEGIAELIRQDKEILVIDHVTGEDITSVTLTQIILDQERSQQGSLPHSFLAGWIQANNDRWSSLQRNMSASLGFLLIVDKEIRRRINLLINRGELSEKDAHTLLEKLLSFSTSTTDSKPSLDEDIERILLERNIPSRDEMEKLNNQLESLAGKLDQLLKE
jgi:polyhydroxyalkanoate synthesis repressor PhaR